MSFDLRTPPQRMTKKREHVIHRYRFSCVSQQTQLIVSKATLNRL